MIAPHCPDSNQLHDYLSGQLDGAAAAELEQHLESCATCEQMVEELETEPDSLVAALQTWRANSPADDDDQNPEILSAQAFAANLADRLRPVGDQEFAALPIIGAYQLIRKLGQGGMGTVYLARHRQLDKQVAIKLLPAISALRPEVVTRFQREIRAAGKLDHTAIVRATDAGEVDGVHFLVMDAIDGLDIGQICRSVGPLSVADACEVARQAALGLAYAHAQGIVHRDVKPSNLMLDAKGQVKILDFGLAQMSVWTGELAELTTVGQLMGTLDYMAPEQAEPRQSSDERSDIYALGATLFRLLCNRPPLASSQAMTPLEKLRLLANHDPTPIDTLRDDIPLPLTKLVMQMLSRDPARRPASAMEVAERLSPFTAAADLIALITTARVAGKEASKTSQGTEAVASERSPAPPPRPSDSKPPINSWKWIALASLAALLGAIAMVMLETEQGQLVIDSKEANVQIKLLKDGQEYRNLTIHPGVYVTKLYRGNYEIILDQPSDNVSISADIFQINRGETVIATVSEKREPPASHKAIAKFKFATVQPKSVQLTQQYVCQLRSHHKIDIRAPAAGYLKEIYIQEGQTVKAGDQLFKLLPSGKVGRIEGIEFENSFGSISAPFDGIVGRLSYQQGSLVQPGETLTTLSDNSVMFAYFNVPETRAFPYQNNEQKGDWKIELLLANGQKFDQIGKLAEIEADVNSQTGNVHCRADFPNPQELLRQGQTGNVWMSRMLPDAIVIPQQATFEKLGNRYVFVVDKAGVAHQREIVIQSELEDQFVVQSGVSVGDTIVVEGIRQVQDGEQVESRMR